MQGMCKGMFGWLRKCTHTPERIEILGASLPYAVPSSGCAAAPSAQRSDLSQSSRLVPQAEQHLLVMGQPLLLTALMHHQGLAERAQLYQW